MSHALLVIDYQVDFLPGGSLGVPGGDEIASRINEHLRMGYSLAVATMDWHPPDHGSFVAQGGPWPPHCIAGTPGAGLSPALDDTFTIDALVRKGQDRDTDGYSGFEGPWLSRLLRDIGTLTVVGLATDYCVKATVLDALRLGFDVNVDADAVRGVNARPGDDKRALAAMAEAGAHVSDY